MLGVNLRVTVHLCDAQDQYEQAADCMEYEPEVEVMRKRALVRFARPSMFKVPMNDVLIVFTALN